MIFFLLSPFSRDASPLYDNLRGGGDPRRAPLGPEPDYHNLPRGPRVPGGPAMRPLGAPLGSLEAPDVYSVASRLSSVSVAAQRHAKFTVRLRGEGGGRGERRGRGVSGRGEVEE